LWADSGSTVLPSSLALDSALPVHPSCKGQIYGGPATGHCLTVRLRADATWKASLATLGWHSGDSGVVVAFAPARSFGQWANASLYGVMPRGIVSASPQACTLPGGCDSALGSFGGETAGVHAAGTYLLGSFVLDLSSVTPGSHSIHSFVREGLGGVFDAKAVSSPVQRNHAIILTPEPGSAWLVGAGLLGLVWGLPRRRGAARGSAPRQVSRR
jgi:hypothetical protein